MRLRSEHLFVAVSLIAIGLRIESSTTAGFSYALVAIYACFGRVEAVRALALSWLLGSLNSEIAPEATSATVGRYAVLFAASASVLFRGGFLRVNSRTNRLLFGTGMLGLFLVGHSLAFSEIVDVSVLKAVAWSIMTITLISAWGDISPSEHVQLSRQIFGGLVVVMLLSLPLTALPLGYVVNGRGFQGILSQPQLFGLVMAFLGVWAAGLMLISQKPSWPLALLVGLCIVLVMLSGARTAGLSLVLAIGAAAAIHLGVTRGRIGPAFPGLADVRVRTILTVVAIGAIVAAPLLVTSAGSYLEKESETSSIVDAYERSRGKLLDPMYENIEQYWVTGIGFGVASYPSEMVIERDPFLGLPTGASIEKGVMPVAVLEELGVFGFIAVALWIWLLAQRAVRAGLAPLALFICILLVNLGENIFFSPGGVGLLAMILIARSVSMTDQISNNAR